MPIQKRTVKNIPCKVIAFFIIFLFLGCRNSEKSHRNRSSFVKIKDSQNLAKEFQSPPASAKPWAFWWWLEGNISKPGILHDLKAMKKVGIGGAIIFDAGSSSYQDVKRTEPGPPFMSSQWKSLFTYAVRTADSLGLGLSMNIGSGWNDGGPWVTPEMAAKKITWSHEVVKGPSTLDRKLKDPDDLFIASGSSKPYFKQVAVLAVKRNSSYPNLPPIKNFDLKAVHRLLHKKYPQKGGYDWSMYLQQDTLQSDRGYDARLDDIINLNSNVDSAGHVNWNVPEGTFDLYRFGYTGTGAVVSTHSPGGGGLAIDYMSSDGMDLQFEHTVGKILPLVKPYIGTGLRFLHDDSWELGLANWTTGFVSAFKKQHGYNPIPYLPILTSKIIENRDVSNRFLYDYRRTIADLIAKNHYGRFRTLAHQYDLGLHPEGGGPHPAPIDGLKNLGRNDIPMGEFWAKVKTHRVGDYERIFVKQSASVAHTYGKKLVQAEGPTSIGPQWEMDPQHIKPTLDRVFCEGLNRLVFHTFTHSPKSAGKPGNEYFAGTHFNPNITWWDQAPAYVNYITRSQLLLQQGKFVADVCYYYGDNVPNQVSLKRVQPGLNLPDGYDYDVADTEVLLKRMSVRDHEIYLPDGMHYKLLILPDRKAIPLDVLKKLQTMVKKGATIVGPRPQSIPGLENYKEADDQLKVIAEKMWGNIDGRQVSEHAYGEGRVIWGNDLKKILLDKQSQPDFKYESSKDQTFIDYIHRSSDNVEIYFLANRKNQPADIKASFRVKGMTPELWNPVNGQEIYQSIFSEKEGRIDMPLHLSPYGSTFVIFHHSQPQGKHYSSITYNGKQIYPNILDKYGLLPEDIGNDVLEFPATGTYELKTSDNKLQTVHIKSYLKEKSLEGSWMVHFSAKWGGPDTVRFDKLNSWTKHDDPGIKYYSGTAVYQKDFRIDPELLDDSYRVELELGKVYNIAEVIVNGKDTGVLWKKPFKVDITDEVRQGENTLEVKVVNLWPNRIIGDQYLPEDKRYTHTNVTKFTKDYPLLPSGLLGPVKLSFLPVRNKFVLEK